MNKLINLSLIATAMFLASCGGNNRTEEIKEYNITYEVVEGAPEATVAPQVTGPNTIKSNEEATVTLTYSNPCTPDLPEFAISSFDNISIENYTKVDYYTATFKIYDAQGDVIIRFFKLEESHPLPPTVF